MPREMTERKTKLFPPVGIISREKKVVARVYLAWDTKSMNNVATNAQDVDDAVRAVTGFTSFAQLLGAIRAHHYVPTILQHGTRKERQRDEARSFLARELRARGYHVIT